MTPHVCSSIYIYISSLIKREREREREIYIGIFKGYIWGYWGSIFPDDF